MFIKRLITLLCFAIFIAVFSFQRRLLKRYDKDLATIRTADDKVVTKALLGNLRHMSRIALPRWTTREGCTSLAFIGLFLVRSILYVMGSHADGKIMELILSSAKKGSAPKRDIFKAVTFFAGIQLMQAATGGLIEHVRHYLIASYRRILTHHFHKKFFDKLTYYHATAIDSRLEAADTVIPIYCAEFAEHFAELPYYFVMPFFDASVSLFEVMRQVGTRPATGLLGVAGVFLAFLKVFTPPFGHIHALLLQREEEFKKKHTDVQTSVEQIALLNGGAVSEGRANYSYKVLTRSLNQMAAAKGFFKLLEDAVGGCAWELVGFLVSWSVIQSRLLKSKRKGWGADKLLSSMVVQRRLVTDFHVAITSMVVNFREVSHLSEFTEKLAEFDRTLDSIARGEFARYVGAEAMAATLGEGEANVLLSSAIGAPQNTSQDPMANMSNTSFTMGSSFVGSAPQQLILNSTERDRQMQQQQATRERDAKLVEKWQIGELKEEGWVPCVMAPALCHAAYTSTELKTDKAPIAVVRDEGAPSPVDASPKMPLTTANDQNNEGSAASAVGPLPPLIRLINTDISTPNGKLLVHHLNLTWEQGQSWAISGPNGCGKSSLLRVLARTWLPSAGEVSVHPKVVFIYVPQTPYFPSDATLAEQVAYPDVPTLVKFEIRDDNGTRKIFAADPSCKEREEEGSDKKQKCAREEVSQTALTAPEDEYDWMVCPKQQRRMREALHLATGRQLLREVIRGWESPVGGFFNPHQKYRSEGHHSSPDQPLSSGGEAETLPIKEELSQTVSAATTLVEKLLPIVPKVPIPFLRPRSDSSTEVINKASSADDAGGITNQRQGSTNDSNHEDHHDQQNFEYYYSHGTYSGCDRSLSWPSLSGGQQQKLSLARAFYHSLKAIEEGNIPVVVMDESTSQMDEASEDTVFKNLRLRGVSMLSVSHRKEVVLRHTHILQLARNPAGWRLVEVNANTVNEALEI